MRNQAPEEGCGIFGVLLVAFALLGLTVTLHAIYRLLAG